jgi:hypothetical protein
VSLWLTHSAAACSGSVSSEDRHQESQSPGVNIFNDVLEPLFCDTLATDRGHEAWCNRFKCHIPFLNGGLFEPLGDYDWRKTDIILPNKLLPILSATMPATAARASSTCSTATISTSMKPSRRKRKWP